MNSPLTRLSNGSWVNPAVITAVRPGASEQDPRTGFVYRARVVVHHGNYQEVIYCNDDEHAQTMADELAEAVNQARVSADAEIARLRILMEQAYHHAESIWHSVASMEVRNAAASVMGFTNLAQRDPSKLPCATRP